MAAAADSAEIDARVVEQIAIAEERLIQALQAEFDEPPPILDVPIEPVPPGMVTAHPEEVPPGNMAAPALGRGVAGVMGAMSSAASTLSSTAERGQGRAKELEDILIKQIEEKGGPGGGGGGPAARSAAAPRLPDRIRLVKKPAGS